MTSGRQLGFLWGGAALVTGLAATRAGQIAQALPACPVHAFAGIPCPTCGAGAAALALSRFDLAGAFTASPLAAVAWIAFIGGGVMAGLMAAAGREIPDPPRRLPWPASAAVISIVAANWAYLMFVRP